MKMLEISLFPQKRVPADSDICAKIWNVLCRIVTKTSDRWQVGQLFVEYICDIFSVLLCKETLSAIILINLIIMDKIYIYFFTINLRGIRIGNLSSFLLCTLMLSVDFKINLHYSALPFLSCVFNISQNNLGINYFRHSDKCSFIIINFLKLCLQRVRGIE